MNGDLFFSIVSSVSVLLATSSLFTSILNIKSKKKQSKDIRIRMLKTQLSELKAMQKSFELSDLQKDNQEQTEETEKLINEIIVQLKQYQDKIEGNAPN